MPSKNKKQKEKLVTPRKSVHVVFFSCPDCGEEESYVQKCSGCNTPMRVIDVVEKFGEEAEKFLEKVEQVVKKEIKEKSLGEDEPNIILMGGTEKAVEDGGVDAGATTDDDGLDIIFPGAEDNDEDAVGTKLSADDELTSALEMLDSEEEDVSASDFGFDGDEIPEL